MGHVTFSPEAVRKKRLFLDPFSYRFEDAQQSEEFEAVSAGKDPAVAKSAPTRTHLTQSNFTFITDDGLSGQTTRNASAATSASASCMSSRQASMHPSPRPQPCVKTDPLPCSLTLSRSAASRQQLDKEWAALEPPQLVVEYTTPVRLPLPRTSRRRIIMQRDGQRQMTMMSAHSRFVM